MKNNEIDECMIEINDKFYLSVKAIWWSVL